MPARRSPGRLDVMTARQIWVTEHYWPDVTEELVLAQSQRLALVRDWWGTIVLPGQQTAFGLFLSDGPADVREALAHVAAPSGHISAGLWMTQQERGSRSRCPMTGTGTDSSTGL